MDENMQNMIMDLAKGNPGALRVMVELWERHGEVPIEQLKEQGITGADIWMLYKDVHGEGEQALDGMVADLGAGG